MANGILIVDKPSGWTSQDVAAKLRGVFHERRVGHGGTLDPMATGVLPIFIGRATRGAEFLGHAEKEYVAGLRLGLVTNTQDTSGETLETHPVSVTRQALEAALTRFTGPIEQIPPMYSAIKIGGKKLYELAREGVTIERTAREIEIYDLTLVGQDSDRDYLVDVSCSKGTYIRTLCEDIGNYLGTGGTLYSLERLSCGIFRKENAVTIEELQSLYEKNDTKALEACLISPEKIFAEFPAVRLSEFFARLCRNGCELYLAKLRLSEADFPEGARVRLYDSEGVFFAVGTVTAYPNGAAIKATVRF